MLEELNYRELFRESHSSNYTLKYNFHKSVTVSVEKFL